MVLLNISGCHDVLTTSGYVDLRGFRWDAFFVSRQCL